MVNGDLIQMKKISVKSELQHRIFKIIIHLKVNTPTECKKLLDLPFETDPSSELEILTRGLGLHELSKKLILVYQLFGQSP